MVALEECDHLPKPDADSWGENPEASYARRERSRRLQERGIYRAGETVHHDNNQCTEGNNIEAHYLKSGDGGRPLCAHCKRLDDERKYADSTLSARCAGARLPFDNICCGRD